MSIFSSIAKVAKSALKIAGGVATGGIVGGVATAASGLLKGVGSKTAAVLPGVGAISLPSLSALPTAAKIAVGGAAVAGGEWLYDQMGNIVGKKHKRRRKGISAKDLTSFKRVARLVDKYAKPVHHFRNIKK